MKRTGIAGLGAKAKNYLLAGLLTILPIWVTWLIVRFLLSLLAKLGGPVVTWLARVLGQWVPVLSDWLAKPWIQAGLGIIVVFLFLCVLGWFATKVVGRKLVGFFDSLVQRIPFVKMIYGSVKKLVAVLQQKPEGIQRVVLIDFPSSEMKAVGLVTRTLIDEDTGRQLAAVYVPTTPNPTSGYLEIVPVERITSTNWTLDEAMTFIVSAGAVAPDKMNYGSNAAPKKAQLRREDSPD